MCKVIHEKLSELGMSKLVEKGVSEDDIMSEVGSSADFINSLQSFVKDNTKLTEAFTVDNSKSLKNFIQRISGMTRKQLEVFMVLCLIFHPIFLFCKLFFHLVILFCFRLVISLLFHEQVLAVKFAYAKYICYFPFGTMFSQSFFYLSLQSFCVCSQY